MAFPMAHIVNIIFNNHEPFFKIFMGRLYKKCIYLIPRYGYKTKVFNKYNKIILYYF